MINCLQGYLNTGLVQSKFVNLKKRQLSAETCHDFIEWCGLLNGSEANLNLRVDTKINLQSCYIDFIEHYPDYGPKAKLTISRIRFNKWMVAFAIFKTGVSPEQGRDSAGKWMRMLRNDEINPQARLNV